MRKYLLYISILFLITFWSAFAYEIDTTRVREPQRPKKQIGSFLLSMPSKILDAPMLIPEGFFRSFVYFGYDIPLGRNLINTLLQESFPVRFIARAGGNGGIGGGLGAKFRDLTSSRDVLEFGGFYTFYDYRRFFLYFDAPHLISQNLGINLVARYDYRSREPLTGIGNNSQKDDEVTYTHEHSQFVGNLVGNVSDHIRLTFGTGYYIHNIFDGDHPDLENNLDSIETRLDLTSNDLRPTRYWSLETGWNLDYRNNRGRPSAGFLNEFRLAYFHGTGRSEELKFYRLGLDHRQYLELFKKRILVLRIMAQSIDVVDADNRPQNPFYLLSTLGGYHGLKGYAPRRFYGKEKALVAVEYRYPLWEMVDALLIFEEGRVFDSFTHGFTFKNWHYSVGTGLIVWGKEDLLFRFDLAFSKETTRLMIRMGLDII